MSLDGTHILLCVSGSIAAYKAAELTRELVKAGATVRVAMTRSATEFVGPMTFEALTGAPVHLDVFAQADGPVDRYSPADDDGSIQHINMSKAPDLILVAPATADLIGRAASGLADDVVTTSLLAADAPIVMAPAMNQRMWANAIVQENVERLKKVGVRFVGPTAGSLACGEVGMGRMAEPADIVDAVLAERSGRGRASLDGVRVLVTLGRTEEDLDPVRYMSNRSSGKMGLAIAKAAARAGADVRVVAGVTSVPVPASLASTHVRTAAEMKDAVHDHFGACDVLIMVAAVADYRAATEKPHKMESGEKRPSIDLEATDDILMSLKPVRTNQTMIGFALETRAEERRARDKLKRKGLDLIVANNPLKEGAGFGTDTNLVSFVRATGSPTSFPVMSKDAIAGELIDEIARLRRTSRSADETSSARGGRARSRGAASKPAAERSTEAGSRSTPRRRSSKRSKSGSRSKSPAKSS